MSARVESIEIVTAQDEMADASYLEQEGMGFEDRLAEYHAGGFYFIGVQAVATIHIPHGNAWIIETISSPGLWGIESDSGDDYMAEVAEGEKAVLTDMLAELCVKL